MYGVGILSRGATSSLEESMEEEVVLVGGGTMSATLGVLLN